MRQPRVRPIAQILYLPGTNCERETGQAFKLAGAKTRLVFLEDIDNKRVKPGDCDLCAIIGGFSYGDWIRCGVIGAIMIHKYLSEVREKKKPIIGICNGFQILMETGIFGSGVALVQNDCKRFRSIPVTHRVVASRCLWTQGLEGKLLTFPSAHGFGKVVYTRQPNVAMVYESDSPNGGHVAAITTDDGLVLGLMDHPERPYGNEDGLQIFRNGVNAVR